MTGWGFAAMTLAFGSAWVVGMGGRVGVARPRSASRPFATLLASGRPLSRAVGWRYLTPALLAALGLASIGLGRGGLSVVVAGAAIGAALAVVRSLVLGRRRRMQRRRRQLDVIELCDSLAAELRAGLPASQALENACAPSPEWAPVVAAARLGGDVPATFRQSASAPGAEGLRVIAASWEVAAHTGAALAVVLDRMALGLRSDNEARAEVTAALGPPRATAKLLAVLPTFGLLLGTSMGARPVDFLLHTGAGWACLAIGVVLALAGLCWVERLASAVELS